MFGVVCYTRTIFRHKGNLLLNTFKIHKLLSTLNLSQSIFQPSECTMNVEPRCKPRPFPNAKENWLDEFRSQTRKDRVKWDTKLYSGNKKFHRQTLYEQIDELVDVAANEFAEWINRLGSDDKNRLNCETIKQLFSIGIEDDVSKSISISFKQRPAISRELADMFDCPEVYRSEAIIFALFSFTTQIYFQLSIERVVERIIAADRRAFRRSGAVNLKKGEQSKTAITNFPEEIRSGKFLFEGIEHLRCTCTLHIAIVENTQ